jgi:GntR family transcriptional regulator
MNAVDRLSPIPLYQQLKQILLQKIQQGEFVSGQVIPGEKQLEEMYGASQITIRRALTELASEGYISRQPGRGTFVLPPKIEHHSTYIGGFLDDLTAAGFERESVLLAFDSRLCPASVAKILNRSEDLPISYVERLVSVSGQPLWLSMCYYNFGDGHEPNLADIKQGSVLRAAKQKYGIIFSRADRTIEAVHPTDREAQLLQVVVTAPMLRVDLVAYNEVGKAVAFVRTLYRDRYKYCHTISN